MDDFTAFLSQVLGFIKLLTASTRCSSKGNILVFEMRFLCCIYRPKNCGGWKWCQSIVVAGNGVRECQHDMLTEQAKQYYEVGNWKGSYPVASTNVVDFKVV